MTKKTLHVLRFTYNTSNMNIIQSILYNQNEVIQLLNPQLKVLKINDDSNNIKHVSPWAQTFDDPKKTCENWNGVVPT